jgi:hypothetical protein
MSSQGSKRRQNDGCGDEKERGNSWLCGFNGKRVRGWGRAPCYVVQGARLGGFEPRTSTSTIGASRSFLPFFTAHRQLPLTTFKGQLTLTTFKGQLTLATSKTLASRPVAELRKRKRFRRVRMRGGKREGLGAVKGALLPRLGSNQIR